MLAFTFKNVLKNFKLYADSNDYIIIAKGAQTGYKYVLEISKDGISCACSTEETSVSVYNIQDIEMHDFTDDSFIIEKLIETSYKDDHSIFEKAELNISYEASLFIKLFRVMHERVYFIFKHNGNFYECYYVDGKALYIEETDKTYNVMGTELYKLSTTHPDYCILCINPPRFRLSYGDYLDKHNKIAATLGKEFTKYKYGTRV